MELKPCPFCGAQMNLGAHKELVAWHKANCFFQLMDEHEVDMTEDELQDAFVSAWNRRDDNVAPARHGRRGKWIEQPLDFGLCGVAYYQCSECGKEQQTPSNYCQFCGVLMKDGDGE